MIMILPGDRSNERDGAMPMWVVRPAAGFCFAISDIGIFQVRISVLVKEGGENMKEGNGKKSTSSNFPGDYISQEEIDIRAALALIKGLHRAGEIPFKTYQQIEKDALKMIDKKTDI